MKKSIEYIEKLSKLSVYLKDAVNEHYSEYGRDEPLTNSILGDIGLTIFYKFYSIEEETKKKIFDLVEEGLLSGDHELGTNLATGLIEAMVNVSSNKDPERWKVIEKYLGKESKEYADAWMRR